MKAAGGGFRSRRGAAVAAALGFLLSAAVILRAAAPTEPRFSLTFAAGGFAAFDSAVSKVYPSLGVPWHVSADWRFAGPWSVFAGFRFLRTSGTTVVVGASFEDTSYAVRMTISSWRAGLRWRAVAGSWNFRLEAGASRFAYEERWTGASIDAKGTSFGGFAGGGVERVLVPWLAVSAGLEYGTMPTRNGGRLAGKPNLGGLDGTVGIVFRF